MPRAALHDQEHRAELFSRLRPRLMAIGYRMLGSVQEAEDLVQDAWLRWHDVLQLRS